MQRSPIIRRPPGYGVPGPIRQQPAVDQPPVFCYQCGRPLQDHPQPAEAPKPVEAPKPGGSKIVPIVLIIAIILALVFGVPYVMSQRPAASSESTEGR